MLTPLLKSRQPRLQGHLLIVLCSYRGGIGDPPPFSFGRYAPKLGPIARLLDRACLFSLREFIASNRDFFANVRSVEYQLGLLQDVLSIASPSTVTIRIEEQMAQSKVCNRLASFGEVEVRSSGDLLCENDVADSVLLIYPDALGLGWGRLESMLATTESVYIVNGRRRIFPLNAHMRIRLGWHRFLATTRVTELLASIVILPLAAGFAAVDVFRGKS